MLCSLKAGRYGWRMLFQSESVAVLCCPPWRFWVFMSVSCLLGPFSCASVTLHVESDSNNTNSIGELILLILFVFEIPVATDPSKAP